LNTEFSLTIEPREIIQRAYPELVCNCKNTCIWCEERKVEPTLIIDCRTEVEHQGGTLANTKLLDTKIYYNSEMIESFINELWDLKGRYHIILLGSIDLPPKASEPINIENPCTTAEMVEKIYCNLYEKGFPFVSVAKGGFKQCHDIALNYKLKIVDHMPEYCFVCNPAGPGYHNKVKSGFKKFTKSMSEVLKSTMSKVKTGISSFTSSGPSNFPELNNYSDSTSYICRKFDKTTNEKSDEEYSLLVMKDEVIIGRYMNHDPKTIVKVLESIKMVDLLKITSMKKFPNVLTFLGNSKQVCVIFEDLKYVKECIVLVAKYFRDIKCKN
jgi:hypothetical protein